MKEVVGVVTCTTTCEKAWAGPFVSAQDLLRDTDGGTVPSRMRKEVRQGYLGTLSDGKGLNEA
jgi:hypothetical protein